MVFSLAIVAWLLLLAGIGTAVQLYGNKDQLTVAKVAGVYLYSLIAAFIAVLLAGDDFNVDSTASLINVLLAAVGGMTFIAVVLKTDSVKAIKSAVVKTDGKQ